MSVRLSTHKTHSDICKQAAAEIAELVRQKPDAVIGLATGNTMEPVYEELVRLYHEEGLDFSQVKFFNLDEFKGIAADDKNSFQHYLRELFLKRVNATEENIHLVSGTDFDGVAYEAEIKKAGGIDIQLLGIGREGHIGFNEARHGRGRDSRSGEVTLAQSTLEDTAAVFGGKDKVPTEAYTMGVGTILDAKKIVMLVNGGHKADIAQKMLSDENVENLPARAILHHKGAGGVSLLMDTPSTEMLSDVQLEKFAGMDDAKIATHRQFFAPIEIPMGEGKAPLKLPYNASVFLPRVMQPGEKFDPQNEAHRNEFHAMLAATKASYVGAHPDDAELWVVQELEESEAAKNKGECSPFLNIIATDGGSYTSALVREGKFSKMTPEELVAQRIFEQQKCCAEFGHNAILLGYPSNTAMGYNGEKKQREIVETLRGIYDQLPNHETAYTHHPVDIHKTHTACVALSVQALREAKQKPQKVLGAPAWGETGIFDEVFPISDPTIVERMLKHFESQVEMQKRAYGENGAGKLRGNGFLHDPLDNSPPLGCTTALNITRAVMQSFPLQQIVTEAYENKKQKHIGMLNQFAPPGSVEAGFSRPEKSHPRISYMAMPGIKR